MNELMFFELIDYIINLYIDNKKIFDYFYDEYYKLLDGKKISSKDVVVLDLHIRNFSCRLFVLEELLDYLDVDFSNL
jgi:hypothetical protein